ncbi:uncharacterized protein LOC135492792 [Lineus longissimus]|uniref:uncharacterized protein LOC135492792 n=1 Tax=Lineus longissimus TaxID=88925 RepID=UPI00315D9C28
MTPGFASSGAYGNNKNCSWEFELPAGLAFEGQFASFDLEASTGCTKDYFQLEQEGNLMGRVCGTYNYNVAPPKKGNSGKGKGRRRRHTFSRWSRAAIAAAAYGHPYNYPTVAGGKVTLIFVSDAQTVGKGAHFKVKLVKPKGPIDGAVKRITMDAKNKQVTITTPGYKNKIPVHPNAKAEWAIQFNKEKYSIACGFLGQFEISADTNTACPRDKLVLQDVNGTAETFCVNKTYGTDLKALDLPIKAETELSVNMTTDKATGRGFSLVCQLFGAIPPACKGNGPQTVEVTNNGNMRIQSPGYDDKLPYPNGLNCSWNIMCPNKRVVMYGDGELDLEGTAAACDKDTVTILEEKRGTDKDQALTICGKKQYAKGKKDKLFVARYNGNVSVSFVTSNKTNGLGFSLLLNCDPCSADCMGVCDGKARLLCSQYCIDGLTGKNETMTEFENVTDCGKRCIVNNTKINELDSCNRCMLAAKKSTWGPLGSSYMDCANTCHSPFAMKKNGADIAKNTTETCDQCIYGTTNKTLSDVKDVCGVCGGKGDTCLDCNQKPNGGAVIDACGKCGGDGTTCQNVPSKVIPDIIPSVTDLTIRVEGAGFVVGKVNEVVFQDATGKEVLKVSAVIENNQNLTTATFQLPAGAYQVFTKTASGTLSKKSLALTVFDSTKIKVIDLTPKEALISTVKTKYTFTFTTENVEDTKKIVCVFIGLYDVTTLKSAIGKGAKIKANSKTTLQRYVMEVPFKSATEIICELDLAIPKSRELTVFASVNGGYHPLTKTFTFPIMAPAPAVKSCKFSDSGAYVDIEFTSAVETRKLKKTSDMFDNFSVFGDKATKLNWKSVKSLRVLIGKGTSLVVIDTVVTFKANAVKSFGQQLSKALTGTEKVAAADKAKDPVAILTGATEAAGCDVLEFLGDQSYGAAGRTWKVFKFEVFDPATGAGLGPNKINITKGKLTVQGADVQTGFKVKLTVTNFLDKTTFVEVNLIINPSPIPKVSLISDKGVTGLKRSDTFSVCAEAELPGGNCKTNGAVNFVWSFPGMDPKQANARCYLFRKYTLNVGTVQLSVTLSIGNSGATVSKTLDLKVLSRPLIAVISNAPAKLGSSSKPANISCIQSIDPDRDASKKISCKWFCQTADGPCMTISDKQIDPFIGNEYTVDPTILIPNTVYTFTLKVSKGTRTASAIKEINVVAGDPPSVIFIPIEGMADSSGRLNVLAFVESAQAITSAKWTSLDKSSDGKDVYAVTELDTKWEKTHVIGGTKKSTYKMVLPPGTLNAGAKFLFSLQVLTASSDSSSLVVLETAPVITGCVVAISLAPYMESDEIELSTSECVASGAQHPLTYTFKYRTTNDGDLTLAPKNKAPSAKIPGPKATSKGKITFVSTVCDTNGNCFDFVNADVVVNPIKQDQSTLDGLVVKMMAKYLRLQLIGAYLDALVMNSNFNKFIIRIRITISAGKRRKRAISVTADGEKNAIGAIESVLKGVLSKSTIDTACQQLSGVDISQMVPADQKKFAGQIAKLLEEGAKEGISNTSIKAALNAAEDLLDAKALTENEYSAIQANAFKGLFKGGAVSQKLEVKTKNSVCTTARHDFSAELTGGDPARPVKVKFPKEMSQTYSDWTCDGVKKCYDLGVVLTHFNAAGYTRGTISAADLKEKSTDIVDVTCNNPATGEKVGVKGLTEPVEVKIPVTSGKTCKNHICKYEDQATGTWKTDGVTFGGCDGEKVICKSSHLSVFMAVNNPTPITPDGNGTKTTDDGAGGADNTGAIIGGVVGGVLAALLVGMFIFFICRIQQRDVIKVDHIEMGKPTMYAYDNTTYTYHGDPDSKVKSTGKNGEPESKVVHM